MQKNIKSNYIYNLIYQMLTLLAPLITTPYLTRVLGSKNLGVFSFVYSIVTIFFLLAQLGLNTYGQREIAYKQDDKKERDKLFWELVIIRFATSIISTLLLLVFSFIVSEYKIFYRLFLLYVLANSIDIMWFYQGIENFKSVSLRNILVKIIYILTIFLLINNSNDLKIYFIIFSAYTLLTNLSFWLGINKHVSFVKFKNLNIKRHIKEVFVLFLPQIASLIYTVLDKTMIGIIDEEIDNVAYYEQASYIVKTILTLITTMGTIMISRMAYTFEKKNFKELKNYITNIINFVWLLGVPLIFGITSVIRNLVPWFYGPGYKPIINLVYYLSPLILVIGLNNIIGIQYLIPTKKQNIYVKSVAIGAIINIILNILLIHQFGAIGAAISSVVAELIVLIIEMLHIKSFISFKELFKPGLKYIPIGILMFIITFFIGNLTGPTIIGTLIQVFIGVIVYLVSLIILKDNYFNSVIKKDVK